MRPMFTPEELAEMAAFDAEIEDEPLTQEEIEASRERDREAVFAEKDKRAQKIAEGQRAYRAANREKIAEGQRAYYAANREKIAEGKRAYRAANREKINAYQREYRRKRRDAHVQEQGGD